MIVQSNLEHTILTILGALDSPAHRHSILRRRPGSKFHDDYLLPRGHIHHLRRFRQRCLHGPTSHLRSSLANGRAAHVQQAWPGVGQYFAGLRNCGALSAFVPLLHLRRKDPDASEAPSSFIESADPLYVALPRHNFRSFDRTVHELGRMIRAPRRRIAVTDMTGTAMSQNVRSLWSLTTGITSKFIPK